MEANKTLVSVNTYEAARAGDDLWFLDVLIDIQVDGLLTFGEIGFMIHNALEDQRNEA